MGPTEEVPGDMVMASGSVLDPHITLANAEIQLDREVFDRNRLATSRREEREPHL